MPSTFCWLYMCAAAKAVAASHACARVVYDLAHPVLRGSLGELFALTRHGVHPIALWSGMRVRAASSYTRPFWTGRRKVAVIGR